MVKDLNPENRILSGWWSEFSFTAESSEAREWMTSIFQEVRVKAGQTRGLVKNATSNLPETNKEKILRCFLIKQ